MSAWMQIAGGLAQGLGAGKMKALDVAEENRRQEALEQASRESQERQWVFQREERKATEAAQAGRDLRLHNYSKEIRADDRAFTSKMAQAGAAAKSEERDEERKEAERNRQHELKKMREEARLNAIQYNREVNDKRDEIKQIVTDEPTGQTWGITYDGRSVALNARARKMMNSVGTGESLLGLDTKGKENPKLPSDSALVFDPETGTFK